MGFSFYKKPASGILSDKVWMTKQACLKGIASEALTSIQKSHTPVVFSFFEDSKQNLVRFLESNRVNHITLTSGWIFESNPATASVFITDPSGLDSHDVTGWLSQRHKIFPLTLLFLGHYPLPETEERILQKLNQLLGPLPILFCLSLEDGLFESMGVDKIKPMMESLGMGVDEPIQHSMVSRAIANARNKLKDRILVEMKAKSESEWFTKNIKGQS